MLLFVKIVRKENQFKKKKKKLKKKTDLPRKVIYVYESSNNCLILKIWG